MQFGWALAGALLLSALSVSAEPLQQLRLLSEHPVEGMRGGNLSGLAMCGNELWTVSDRDDEQIYRLDTRDPVWQAQTVHIDVPPVPESGLPWGLSSRTWAASFIRGGDLDFEGISCDSVGNRYIVSEAHAAVLQVPVSGPANWLKISPLLVREARASGLLLKFNSIFEGLAINPAGDQIWLAAERQKRGLLLIKRQQTVWDCDGRCVLLSEGGKEMQPPQFPKAKRFIATFPTFRCLTASCLPLNATLSRSAVAMHRRPKSSNAGRMPANCCRNNVATRRTTDWRKR